LQTSGAPVKCTSRTDNWPSNFYSKPEFFPHNTNIATQYLTRLQLQPDGPLGPEYELTYLAAEMDINKNDNYNPEPIINKFRNDRDTQNNDLAHRREGKFKYRRKVQCTCCHNYGHDVDEQICRIGAQVYHSHQFLTNNPQKAQYNAQAYSLSNIKKQIKKLLSDPTTPDDDIQDKLEGLAVAMVQQLYSAPCAPTDVDE
jgi:hypothetical protein